MFDRKSTVVKNGLLNGLRPTKLGLTICALLVLVPAGGFGVLSAAPKRAGSADIEKQRTAFGEVRSIALAIKAFRQDFGVYPDAGKKGEGEFTIVEMSSLQGRTLNPKQKEPGLAPAYIPKLPVKDPWGHPYLYGVSADLTQFVVVCTGSDGVLKTASPPKEEVATTCLDDDIIFVGDKFVQYPKGVQYLCK